MKVDTIWRCWLKLKSPMLRLTVTHQMIWTRVLCTTYQGAYLIQHVGLVYWRNKSKTMLWRQRKINTLQAKHKKISDKNVEKGHWFATNVEAIRCRWCTRKMVKNHEDTYWWPSNLCFQDLIWHVTH